MTKQKKVVIIGGGLGGLSTAINLLDSNFEVTIIEKNKNLGGKMNIFQKSKFFKINSTALYGYPASCFFLVNLSS